LVPRCRFLVLLETGFFHQSFIVHESAANGLHPIATRWSDPEHQLQPVHHQPVREPLAHLLAAIRNEFAAEMIRVHCQASGTGLTAPPSAGMPNSPVTKQYMLWQGGEAGSSVTPVVFIEATLRAEHWPQEAKRPRFHRIA
jgi:hypothetical protein